MSNIDWADCEFVERVPGKMGGKAVIKGTRIEPETILIDEEYGRTPEQTQASYLTLSMDTILKVRSYGHKRKLQLQS